MASLETLEKLKEHPEWIAPRSDIRVFLGEPGAPEATKTTVEPGNVFSPGMLTYGVTWWLRFPESGDFFATETAPLEALKWSFEEGYLPVIHCNTSTNGLDVRHTLFQDGNCAEFTEAVSARLGLSNNGHTTKTVQVFIAMRSIGPAGGPLTHLSITEDQRGFYKTKSSMTNLLTDRTPDAAGCGVGDPSPLAMKGQVPSENTVKDPAGWAFGLQRYDLTLKAGESWTVHIDCSQQGGRYWDYIKNTGVPPRPEAFDERCTAVLADWRARFENISIDVPDEDFRNSFFAGIQHLLIATVGDQAHIAALAYPLVWLRDGVYIMRALDQAGFHDIARKATEYCVRNDFFGGFGAEGDAPGEGIWALVSHYHITQDKNWLEKVYPAIRRKCEWLFKMRRTDKPIQVVTDNPVLAFFQGDRFLGIICVAARDGIIRGTMDMGVTYSAGFVNHWALCGLRSAAYAATEMGYLADAAAYNAEADELQACLEKYIKNNPDYFSHERTANSLLWPTHAWENKPGFVEEPFNAWWAKNRGSAESDYLPELYWLYFEFAQAHNALLLGQRERAWRVVEYRLKNQDLPGLYGWREGKDGVGMENVINGVTLFRQLRGCQKYESVTPHGWSQAELWLLQRAMLVEEYQNKLLLFAGVPDHWLKPGAHIGFEKLPTWFGKVSASLNVSADGKTAQITICDVAPGTQIRVLLPGNQVEVNSGSQNKLSLNLTLNK
jgi:hypothetical protein